MPAGQFKTRRNEETGRLESIPEEERQSLLTEAGVPELPGAAQPPPLPDPFITTAKESMQGEPLPGEAEPVEEEGPPDTSGLLGTVGRVAGAAVGGPAAAAVGGAAGFLLGQALKQRPKPIGTLEGGNVTEQNDSSDVLRQLLAVQRGIAKAGAPIKDAIQTQAAGSRM